MSSTIHKYTNRNQGTNKAKYQHILYHPSLPTKLNMKGTKQEFLIRVQGTTTIACDIENPCSTRFELLGFDDQAGFEK